MTDKFKSLLLQKHLHCNKCPSNESVIELFEDVLSLLFPDYSGVRFSTLKQIDQRVDSMTTRLEEILNDHPELYTSFSESATNRFIESLEKIESALQMDIDAIYAGDPAAKSKEEVIRSYPGFYAITAYRIAHALHNLGIKVIPRIITQHAHHKTGIDIHPGAQIDHSFCIDHGTGVVIGETCVIGHNVKIYQGVTLGALSVKKVDADKKRHPTIEPYVILYANSTILGGDTIIGEHSIIGGNSWITKSVEPHSTIHYVVGNNQVKKLKK
jgi:serine O-acetyltransferase